jgi:aminoglycoside/choline kinase family phosphotransferase
MSMSHDQLLEKMALALPGFVPAELQPIEKGGSSRRFFRVRSNGGTAILVHDLGEKEENRHYAAAVAFLQSHGVPVPGVITERPEDGLLWLQDLGEQDLWSFRNESWDLRRALYRSALRGAAKLHLIAPESPSEMGLQLQKGFDAQLYRWEQGYFVAHCLGGLFSIPKDRCEDLLEDPAMLRLAKGLADRPRHLVHRDFQSQNILIRDGDAWFIDFQGMRAGLPEYDLASLLCDPYVEITHSERETLLNDYRAFRQESGSPVGEDFLRVFWQCATQRLMQALGAYGNLSIHCGKPSFRAHVAPALVRLRDTLDRLHPDDRLDGVADVVANLKE